MLPNKFHEWMIQTHVRGHYGSIQLVDMTFHQDEAFIFFAKQALKLVQTTDPRRFHRIEKEIRYLVNSYLIAGAEYRRGIKRCSVDFERYRVNSSDPRYDWYIASFASMLVHEATHGHIYSQGIPYNKRTWLRVERLCCKEAARFAAHLHSESYDLTQAATPFDEKRYLSYRQLSWLVRARQILPRVRNNTQNHNQSGK